MTIWLKVRHALPSTAVAIGSAIVLVPIADLLIPVPQLFNAHGLSLPLAVLAPLSVSTVLAFDLIAGDERLESVSSRPIATLDLGFVVLLTGVAALTSLVAARAGIAALGTVAARDVYGYVGLMLLGRRLPSIAAASVAPAAYALMSAFFGGTPTGHPLWWAWPLAASGDLGAWIWAIVLFLAGAGSMVVLPPRRT